MTDPIIGPDGEPRCAWSRAAPEFLHYHDAEWGFPVADDRRLFADYFFTEGPAINGIVVAFADAFYEAAIDKGSGQPDSKS